LKMTG